MANIDPNWLFQDWFRFHTGRWLSSERVYSMTLEQKGAYIQLLVLAYSEKTNRISTNEAVICEMMNCDIEQYERSVLPVLKSCFGKIVFRNKECWYNEMVEEELMWKHEKSSKFRENRVGKSEKNVVNLEPKVLKNGAKASPVNFHNLEKVGAKDSGQDSSPKRSSDSGRDNGFFEIPKIPPFMDPKSSMYRPEMVDKTPIDNQSLSTAKDRSPDDCPDCSVLSYLILKGGAGGIWKWVSDPEPEFGWFGSLQIRKHFFQILETARILANIEPAVPGKPEIFLDKLFSEFSKVPDFQAQMQDGILMVDCGQGVVSFRLVDKPELDEVGDWDMNVQVVAGQIDDSVEALGGVYLSLGGKWDKPDGKKPKISVGKPKTVKAKIDITTQEMAQHMVDAYADRITDKMKEIWLDRTTKYLKSFTLEEAHEIMAKFITFMADFYAPYHDYRKAEDPINFYQPFVQPETYIKSGNWNCRPQIGTHRIEGWN